MFEHAVKLSMALSVLLICRIMIFRDFFESNIVTKNVLKFSSLVKKI